MTLAAMLATDRDAFICDMAETYQIFDYRAVPVDLLAILASGLRDGSRIRMRMAGVTHIPHEYILPLIADRLTALLQSCGGAQDAEYLTDVVFGRSKKQPDIAFNSGEDFMTAWSTIVKTEGEENG